MRVGEEVSLEVESLAHRPDALCRIGNYVLFHAGALPGEKILARVTSAARKYGRADLLEVERRSPDRVGPKCEHFLDCGGCHFQHMAYPAQLEHKTQRLAKTLGFALQASSLPILDMQGPEDPWGQRNKIALHLQGRRGEARAGLFRMHSREVVPILMCPVQDEFGTDVAFRAVDAVNRSGIEPWDEAEDRGALRAVVVRATRATKQAQVTLVTRRHIPRLEKLVADLGRIGATGVSVNLNERPGPQLMGRETTSLAGPARIVEKIGGVTYLSSPGAFFQTSAWGAAFLVEAIRRLVDAPANARVIDLYSGGGLLSLALADRVREVIGLEENPGAVGDAVASARANGFTNTRFLSGRAEHRIRELTNDGGPPWAVVLDPPREGCDPIVVDAVARMRPTRVVYVSCDPVSLGRDAALFEQRGYELTRVEPLDMFPHAFHIETVALFERS